MSELSHRNHHETALQNQSLDYTPMSDLVLGNLTGQRLAAAFLDELKSGYVDSDSLYLVIKSIAVDGQDMASLATLRGACRIIQKTLEWSLA